MAGVRDPAFWKRFSMAVHLDEENAQTRPEMKHSDSWLARQNRKSKRRGIVCWVFWVLFLCFVAAVVAVIIWGVQSGVFEGVTDNANPNGGSMGDAKRSVGGAVLTRQDGPIIQLADLRDGVMGQRR